MTDYQIATTRDVYRNLSHTLTDEGDTTFFSDLSTLAQVAEAHKSVIHVYNFKTMSLDYVSPNAQDILGYSAEEAMEKGAQPFLQNIDKAHTDYLPTVNQMIVNNRSETTTMNDYFKSCACGLIYRHPKGIKRLKIQHLTLDEGTGKPSHRFMYFIQDVSHLLKKDFYWIQMVFKNENEVTKSYTSETRKFINGAILSDREKEVFHLFQSGKESEEVAQTLFLSRATVNNHRQNMLNKLGAKDMTALMTLAYACDLN